MLDGREQERRGAGGMLRMGAEGDWNRRVWTREEEELEKSWKGRGGDLEGRGGEVGWRGG